MLRREVSAHGFCVYIFVILCQQHEVVTVAEVLLMVEVLVHLRGRGRGRRRGRKRGRRRRKTVRTHRTDTTSSRQIHLLQHKRISALLPYTCSKYTRAHAHRHTHTPCMPLNFTVPICSVSLRAAAIGPSTSTPSRIPSPTYHGT